MAAAQAVVTAARTAQPSYRITELPCIRDPAWDDFLAQLPCGRQPQSSLWAQVKLRQHCHGYRILAERHGAFIGGAQVLVRQVLKLGTVGVVAHGPALWRHDEALATQMIDRLIDAGRHHHLMSLVIQPPPGAGYIEPLLISRQFHVSPAAAAPCASTVLDLSSDLDTLMAGMRRQTRQNVRRSLRDGIVVTRGTRDDLETFYAVHSASSERQGFSTYSADYFLALWDLLEPEGSIALFIGSWQAHPVSTLLVTTFGKRVYAKFSGWTGAEHERRPNEAVFWHAIMWAKESGYRWFDFEGFDRRDAVAILNTDTMPDEWHNTSSFFKYGFGGELQLYPQAYHLVFNPLLRWAINQVGLPLLSDHSAIRNVPLLRRLTPEAVQRFVNHQRTHSPASPSAKEQVHGHNSVY